MKEAGQQHPLSSLTTRGRGHTRPPSPVSGAGEEPTFYRGESDSRLPLRGRTYASVYSYLYPDSLLYVYLSLSLSISISISWRESGEGDRTTVIDMKIEIEIGSK